MAGIGTTLAIYDQMSRPLENIRSAMDKTVSSFEKMQDSANNTFDSSEYDKVAKELKALSGEIEHAEKTQYGLNSAMEEMSLSDVQSEYNSLNNTIDATEDQIRQNNIQQERFSNEVNRSNSNARRLVGTLTKVATVIGAGTFIKGGFDRLMGIDTAQAKLQALGHSAEGVAMITNNAMNSVTGTAFRMEDAVTTAASAVAAGIKPGMELERYLGLTADTAAIAGESMKDMGAIFNKIATDGRIQAQELNQLGERGIPIIQHLAEELGVAADEVRQLASQGKISSRQFLDAVETAFGGAAEIMGRASLSAIIDNIGASLSRMSAYFLNGAQDGRGFFDTVKPLLVDLLEWMRSVEKGFIVFGQIFGEVFNRIISGVQWVYNAFSTYWGMISPIIYAVVGALGAYYSAIIIARTVTAIMVGVQTALAIAISIMRGTAVAATAATYGLTVAQWALNSAMLANPVFLIVLGVLLLIGVFYAAIAAINHFTDSTISATGVVAGAFAWLGGLVANIFIVMLNIGIGIVNGLINVFQIGLFLIQMAFWGLAFAVLTILQTIINGGILVINWLVHAWHIGVFLLHAIFIGLATVALLIFDGIVNGGILVINVLVNAWHQGVYLLQIAFIVLVTFLLVIFDTVMNAGMDVIVWLVNSWRKGIYLLQLGFANLKKFILDILQGVVDFGISAAEGLMNAWNNGIYGLEKAFHSFRTFVSKIMQAVGQGSIGIVDNVLGAISDLVNQAIKGLNNIIRTANNIPGVNISTVGTVDLKVGSGVRDFVDSFGESGVTPTAPELVNLGRPVIFDSSAVEMPDEPEPFEMTRSTAAQDYLDGLEMPERPEWENLFEHQSNMLDFLEAVEMPEFPELEQTIEYQNFLGDFLEADYRPEAPSLDPTFESVSYVDMGAWFDSGYKWGQNLENQVRDFSLTDAIMDLLGIEIPEMGEVVDIYDDLTNMDLSHLEDMLDDGLGDLGGGSGGGGGAPGGGGSGGGSGGGGLGRNVGRIADNTDDIADDLGITSDDLKYLRDLASRDYVNRYTNNEINFSVGGITNNVDSELDLDGVIDYMTTGLERAVDTTVEGRYT